MEKEQSTTFKSDSLVMVAADAALAAASEVLKGSSDDLWLRQKAIRAALEAALTSVVTIS